MDKRKVWSVVVGCVVKHNGKVLILKRPEDEDVYPGIWELPSGKVEFGESLTDSIIREVKEETSLVISNPKLVGYFQYKINKPGLTKFSVQINFVSQINQVDSIRLTEHETFTWVNEEDLDHYKLTQDVKKLIKSVFRQ